MCPNYPKKHLIDSMACSISISSLLEFTKLKKSCVKHVSGIPTLSKCSIDFLLMPSYRFLKTYSTGLLMFTDIFNDKSNTFNTCSLLNTRYTQSPMYNMPVEYIKYMYGVK